MQDIAQRLVAAGASLEAWSWRSSDLYSGGTGLDSQYGHANGTPLFWAVQANCRQAVEILLNLGARVFPQSKPARRTGRHYSPVHWAARMHQSEILHLLLRNYKANTGVTEVLNTAWEAAQEGSPAMLPLGLATSYPGGLVLARMLLHGANHIEQCFKTVHLLLDRGADVGQVSAAENSAFGMAANLGPPYGLRALLTWRDGRLRPDIADWAKYLSLACINDDRSTFDELRAIDVVANEHYTWPSILAEVALRTDETYYLNAIITKHQELDPAPADYSAAFFNAWSRGHEKAAQAIFERGRCDVGMLSYRPHLNAYRSILGDLIWDAKFHPSHVKTIDAFLKLFGERDSVFENVIKMGDSPPTVMNALQYTLTYRPGSNVSTGVDILQVLTKYFNDQIKHLSPPFGPERSSLLHMAVQMGNLPAAGFLLTLHGVDARYRNANGFAAFDLCVIRWQDSARNGSLVYTGALEAGVPEAKAGEQWETKTRLFMNLMQRRGASRFGSISHAFKMLSAEELQMIEIDEDGEFTIFKGSYQGKQSLPYLENLFSPTHYAGLDLTAFGFFNM
ncbi:hypothetical protein VTI74DRAFT_3133 [Chaetomium olivicolor]